MKIIRPEIFRAFSMYRERIFPRRLSMIIVIERRKMKIRKDARRRARVENARN